MPSEFLNHAASPPPGIRAMAWAGYEEELVDAISNREPYPPVFCLERLRLECLKSDFVGVKRCGVRPPQPELRWSCQAAWRASSMAPELPLVRSATTIMCLV